MHRRRSPRASPLGRLGGIKTVAEVRARHRRDRERDAARETPHEQLLRALAKLTEREREAKAERDERDAKERAERDEREQRARDERERMKREREQMERMQREREQMEREQRERDLKNAKLPEITEFKTKKKLDEPKDASDKAFAGRGLERGGDATPRKEPVVAESATDLAQRRMRDLQAEFDRAQSGTDELLKHTAFALIIRLDELDHALNIESSDDKAEAINSLLAEPLLTRADVLAHLETSYKNLQEEVGQFIENAEKSFAATKLYEPYGAAADGTFIQQIRAARTSFDNLLLTVTEKMSKFQNATSAEEVRGVDAQLTAEENAKEEVKALSLQVRNQEQEAYASYKKRTRQLYIDITDITQKVYGGEDVWKEPSERMTELQRRASSVLQRRQSVVDSGSIPLEKATELVKCERDAAAIKTEVDAEIAKAKKPAPGSLASLKAKIDELFYKGLRELAVSATVMYVFFEDNGKDDDMSPYIQAITKAESDGNIYALIEHAKDRLTQIQNEIVRDGKSRLEALNSELSGSPSTSQTPDIARQLADALAAVAEHSMLVKYCYGTDGDSFDEVYGTIEAYRRQAQEAATTAQQLRAEVEQARAAAAVAHAHAKAIRVTRKTDAASAEIALLNIHFECDTVSLEPGAGIIKHNTVIFVDPRRKDGKMFEVIDKSIQTVVNKLINSEELRGRNSNRIVCLLHVPTEIDQVPDEFTVAYGGRDIKLTTYRRQRNVALVYAPDDDVLVDEDGEFFACTLIPVQPIVQGSTEIKREDYCAGTSRKRLRAESMYLCHRKVLAFALAEKEKQVQRMFNKKSGHEIDGDFDRVFVTSDIHADLRKFVQILLACKLISIGDYRHDQIYEDDNIYEIVWEARWVASKTLLVICGDLIDGKRAGNGTGDVRGSYEFLLHCLLFNLRIQARDKTLRSDVRFTIGNHDAATVTSFAPPRMVIAGSSYIEDCHVEFAPRTDAHASHGNGIYIKRRNMLLPFYACSPYIMLTMGRAAFVHAGFVNDYNLDSYGVALARQTALNEAPLEIEVSGLLSFFAHTRDPRGTPDELWSRAYASEKPCTTSEAHRHFDLIAVGHCITHQHDDYMHLKPVLEQQCENDFTGTHGCVLTRDCKKDGGPLIALVDTGMSASMRDGGTIQARTEKNKSRHVGMLVLDKTQRSGESLGKVNDKYNVYRIRAMSEMRFLLNNGREPSMLVIGGQTVPLKYTEDGAMEQEHQACLENWAADWSTNPRIAQFTPTRGRLTTTGQDYPIVEIHNNANGNCLLEALGFYLCVSGKWQGTVDKLRSKLLGDVKDRLLTKSDSVDREHARNEARDTQFKPHEHKIWEDYKAKLTDENKRSLDANPEEATMKKYVYICRQSKAYLGKLEIDAFARLFSRTVCVWYNDKRGKFGLHYRSLSRTDTVININEAQIENFESVVHLYYYPEEQHFTLLALKVPTQETASSFGRKRARLYV